MKIELTESQVRLLWRVLNAVQIQGDIAEEFVALKQQVRKSLEAGLDPVGGPAERS